MPNLEWYQWNPFMFQKLNDIIKDGWIFADVGSNHGEFIDFFRTFRYNDIYAFELNPVTAEKLKIRYKEHSHIIIENYAVCDKDGEIDFYDGGEKTDDACHNILGHNMQFENTKKLGTVKSIKLDSYFNEIKINMMKIDVEGAELRVLKGMQNSIKNIDYILIECHLDKDWPEIREILLSAGFSCTNFYDDTPITESHRPYQCFGSKLS